MRSSTAQKTRIKRKTSVFKQKRPNFVSLRGRIAAVAILKSKVWHPVAKHGAPARRISNISEIKVVGFPAKPTIFVPLRGAQRRGNLKVIDVESRSEAQERKTTKYPNSDPSRRDTTTALFRDAMAASPREGIKAECGRWPHSAHWITFYASKSSKSSKSESV